MQHVEWRVLAPLRNQRFVSLSEAHTVIELLAEELDERPFQKIAGNRQSVFEELDRATLRPLRHVLHAKAEG